MSGTNYIASNWRVPENSNSSKNDNYSLSFDGSSDVLTWGQTDLPAAHTISFWVKMGGLSTDYRTILIDTTYAPSTPPVRRIYLRLGRITYIDTTSAGSTTLTTTNDVGTILTDGDWHHVVVVRNDTVGTIYIDNVNKTDDAAIGSLTTPFYLTRTGETITSYGSIFIGDLSDISFFDYALDSSQISTLYGDATSGAGNPMALKPTPVAYYPLGDNSSGGIDIGPTSILTQPNVSVDDASVFEFDGTNYVESSNISELNGSAVATWSGWIKRANATGGYYTIGTWGNTGTDRQMVLFQASNLIRVLIGDGTIFDTAFEATLTADTEWHNIIIVYDGSLGNTSKVKLYYDTTPLTNTATGTNVATLNTSSNGFTIGALGTGTPGVNWFEGEISNVAIWDTDQTLEISNIYNNGIPATSYTNTPIAWWKLDQSANWDVGGSGNWTIPDASGNGYDGTSSGMTSGNLVLSDLTRNLPYENYSMAFDGTEYIETASTFSLLDGQTSATFSIWIKPNAVNIFQYLFSIVRSAISTQFQVACHLDTLARIRVYGDTTSLYTYSNTGVVSAGVWTHLCITFDLSQPLVADRVVIYVNGVDETDPSFRNMAITQFQTSTSGMSIAKNQNNHLPEFEGLLSQFSVFNSTLTSTEVLKLYANGLPQDLTNFTPQPDSWWTLGKESFWNGSDWIVRDMIGSNDGTSANMAVSDLVGDAPRSEANGTGTNMDIPTNLVGNAGFSDKNAYSINMGPSARVTDIP
jgi:hypothetical protein